MIYVYVDVLMCLLFIISAYKIVPPLSKYILIKVGQMMSDSN